MKIKTIQAVNAYNILKDFKVSNLNEDSIISLWSDLKLFRPIAEEYNKTVEDTKKTLQDDKYNEMLQRVRAAQERESKVKSEGYVMTEDDIKDTKEINEYFAEFNKKGNEYFNSLKDAEIDLDIKTISNEELIKVMKDTNNGFETMLKLDFITE